MYCSKLNRTLTLLCCALAAVSLLAGCASQTKAPDVWWGDPETGVILEHRMPEGEALNYEMTSDFLQTMEVMGNPMEVISERRMAYTVTPAAVKGKSQQLGITIDDFELSISMPQGDMTAAADDVIGAEFEMTLSTLGVESGYEKANEIRYDLGTAGKRGMGTEFSTLFIDMPGEPVSIGDSWNSTTTIVEDEDETQRLEIIMDGVNTLAGFELVGGYDCARIETEYTGTMKGNSVQGGANIVTTGELSGSGTTDFAYKKGLVVSEFSMGVADGDMKVEGPQEMTIPLTREFTMENNLVVLGEETSKRMKEKPSARLKKEAKPIEEPGPTLDMEPDMRTAGPITVMGVQKRYESPQAADFEEQWTKEFMAHHDAVSAMSSNKRYYGVSYAVDEDASFDYLAGMAVGPEAEIPEGLVVREIPLATFAVFEANMETISETWDMIFAKWLPTSGYEYDGKVPGYEEYPPDTGENSTVLICVPVRKVK